MHFHEVDVYFYNPVTDEETFKKVEFEYYVEDTSFSYIYGSEHGTTMPTSEELLNDVISDDKFLVDFFMNDPDLAFKLIKEEIEEIGIEELERYRNHEKI